MVVMENPQRVVLVLMETLTREILGELSKYLVAEHIYRNVTIKHLSTDSKNLGLLILNSYQNSPKQHTVPSTWEDE